MRSLWRLLALLHVTSFGQCAGPVALLDTHLLGDAAGADSASLHLPRESYNPTPKERTAAVDEYRQAPNKGLKITDHERGDYRRPTQEEAETATAESVAYHSHHIQTLRKLATGNRSGEYSTLPINTPENERNAAEWATTGAKRAQAILAEQHPYELSPATPASQQSQVYTPGEPKNPHLPRQEPVFIKEFTGQDQVAMMNPITNPPPFDDCKEGPSYVEHSGMDTDPVMTDAEKVYPGRAGNVTEKETSKCETQCSADLECLGYVETAKADDGAECWLIPKTCQSRADYNGAKCGTVNMSAWAQNGMGTGSTFIKSPKPHANTNCGLPTSSRELIPASDFGPPVSTTIEISDTELQNLQVRQKAFLDKQLSDLDTIKDAMTISERQAKAAIWFRERKSKLIKEHNAELRTKAERTKKTHIVHEITAKRVSERAQKAADHQSERWAKSIAARKKDAAIIKEKDFKASPAGQLKDATFVEQTEETYAQRTDDSEAHYIREAIRANESRAAEKKRIAKIQVNISGALALIADLNKETQMKYNATGTFPNETIPTQSKLYKAMQFLQDEDIPY